MKALVLSGGRGTRLRPITHTSAKQLVPVANKPILFYAIEAILAAGIDDIGIVVGDTREEIKAACGSGSQWGCKITYIEQESPLGIAHGVKIARDFLGDSPFVMYLGDNLIIDGIAGLVDEFRQGRYNAQILLSHVRNPEEFGVAELDGDGRILRLVEKPKQPKTDLVVVGVYMFDKSVFTAVDSLRPSARGELEITEAIQYLIDRDYDVQSHIVKGYWKDTGKLEDMLEANRMVLDGLSRQIDGEVDAHSAVHGKVQIQAGAKIVGSVVRGPAIIGANTTIENAYVGPYTSIYHNCTVRLSEVEHSIVLEHSTIDGIASRIEDSLIGKNVTVSRTDQKPAAYRLMLGDNSVVSIL